MKKKLLSFAFVLLPILALPQVVEDSAPTAILEQEKDSTKFKSIADIVRDKEEETSYFFEQRHNDQLWSRNNYFNISYNASTLIPKEDVISGLGLGNSVQIAKSNFGISLESGKSYPLHKKKPIYNMLEFYIDFTSIDLSFNHYQMGGDGKYIYNSTQKWTKTDKNGNLSSYYYIPWDLEKYEGSFGMSVGPSFSVLPFRYIKDKNGLHFLKFNMYFHVGYQASILYMVGDDTTDMNTDKASEDFKMMSENLKMNWGHGLLTSFGLSLTWKGIGIGYEHRVAHNKYQPITTGDFGSSSYKFKTSTDRFYISFRMGK